MTRPFLDLSVYLIVGPSHVDGDPVPLVRAAVAGGVTLVQLRDKTSDDASMIDAARRLKAALDGTGVPLLINDRPDICKAAGADGVHLGQDDAAPVDTRRFLGSNAIIGVTVKRPEQARALDPAAVDYASIGGIFQTTSKDNPDPPIGLSGLGEMVDVLRSHTPSMLRCAIAGIDEATAGAVIACGVDGVCIASAITQSPDPESAARRIAAAVRAAKDSEREGPEREGMEP